MPAEIVTINYAIICICLTKKKNDFFCSENK